MSKQTERENFLLIMQTEGVPADVARLVMRHAASLHRLAELQCSSEAYDRDQVRCPGVLTPKGWRMPDDPMIPHAEDCIRRASPAAECSCFKSAACLCHDYGNFDAARVKRRRVATCLHCNHTWRFRVEMSEHTANISGEASAFCPKCNARSVSAAPIQEIPNPHGMIPRGAVREKLLQACVTKLLAPFGATPVFHGDPRGAVVKLRVPSGKTDDWGRTGVCVP